MKTLSYAFLIATITSLVSCQSQDSRDAAHPKGEQSMESTITCGKHLCRQAMIDSSEFDNVSMTNVSFNNVALTGSKFRNINMSNTDFYGIEFQNAKFKAVGLNNVEISECTLEGTRINGVLVSDLFDAYEKQQAAQP